MSLTTSEKKEKHNEDDQLQQQQEDKSVENELAANKTVEQHMADLVSAEEYLDHVKGIQMLPYQRQMFLDMAHSDGLIVCAKYA